MRFATFSGENAEPRLGLVIDDDIADLSAVDGAPPSVLALLAESDWNSRTQSLTARAARQPLTEVKLLAPIARPGKYMAIGLNTRGHRKEVNLRWLLREPRLLRIAAGYVLAHPKPRYPYFFGKATSSITGPFDPIVLPPRTSKVDWEGELAVVIGTHAHDVDVQTAARSIAGYTITNDVSVRDWQFDNPTTAALAKSYPTHGPLGPWIVTADDIDLDDVELRTYLNAELRQRGRVSDLIRSPAEIVSKLSKFCLLEPGDVIACGTFAGTGWPVDRFLRQGDQVRVEIDGIGHINNPVIDYTCGDEITVGQNHPAPKGS